MLQRMLSNQKNRREMKGSVRTNYFYRHDFLLGKMHLFTSIELGAEKELFKQMLMQKTDRFLLKTITKPNVLLLCQRVKEAVRLMLLKAE